MNVAHTADRNYALHERKKFLQDFLSERTTNKNSLANLENILKFDEFLPNFDQPKGDLTFILSGA